MISVIVCSRREPAWDLHERNIAATIGVDYEYIRIENTTSPRGICAVYNEGAQKARYECVVFVHEDVFFMEQGWGKVLLGKFTNAHIGLVGVAGTEVLYGSDLRWHIAGQPHIKGRLVHEIPTHSLFVLTVYSWDKTDAEVVVADGLFLAMRKSLFSTIRFDDATFKAFHFYDFDICMQVRTSHSCIVTWDILVKHFSGGKNDPTWHDAAALFKEKYAGELPALTPGISLPKSFGPPAQNFDLSGKAQPGILI